MKKSQKILIFHYAVWFVPLIVSIINVYLAYVDKESIFTKYPIMEATWIITVIISIFTRFIYWKCKKHEKQ